MCTNNFPQAWVWTKTNPDIPFTRFSHFFLFSFFFFVSCYRKFKQCGKHWGTHWPCFMCYVPLSMHMQETRFERSQFNSIDSNTSRSSCLFLSLEVNVDDDATYLNHCVVSPTGALRCFQLLVGALESVLTRSLISLLSVVISSYESRELASAKRARRSKKFIKIEIYWHC